MKNIEFVSYDGKWPTLCYGNLVLKIDGADFIFRNVLTSGGEIVFSEGWTDVQIIKGLWRVGTTKFNDMYRLDGYEDDSPHIYFTEAEIKWITMLVNENIEEGCCGGCV